MSRIEQLFSNKHKNLLNIYCTAGYPRLDSIIPVMKALQQNGADMIEVGMPYSDPVADGPVIQQSNMVALGNGMSIPVLFDQLKGFRQNIHLPVILMGYLNPIMQYGIEDFCKQASSLGIDGLIIPDLPIYEYEVQYKAIFKEYSLDFILLITPETGEDRIREIDSQSSGFLYAVSSSSTTGGNNDINEQETYFMKLRNMHLNNPILVGFGIKDRDSFLTASRYTHGAIIGSAYIKALENAVDINKATSEFLHSII